MRRRGRARVGNNNGERSYESGTYFPSAKGEAKTFALWVKRGTISVEEIRKQLQVTPRQRAVLEKICGKLVASQSTGFRRRVLMYFEMFLRKSGTRVQRNGDSA
jgi:hypothetical protein